MSTTMTAIPLRRTNTSRTTETPAISTIDLNEDGRTSTDGILAPDKTITGFNNAADHDFPDGGLEAWLVVFGAFCALFLVFSMVASTAIFQDYLSNNQLEGTPPEKIGWIFSVNLFLTFFCGIYTGQIFDTYGPRIMVATGSAALVSAIMLLSVCTQYWHFLLTYGVLGGVGGALLLSAAFPAIGHFFLRRRAYAQGLANTAGSIGGIAIPLMLRSLVIEIGFAWSARVLGFIFLAVAVPANIFIKARFLSGSKNSKILPDLTVLRNPGFVLFAAGMFAMEWGLFVPVAFLATYTTHTTGQDTLGYVVIAVYNAGTFFGRWLPGLLADKVGRVNVSVVSMTLSCISILALWLPATNSVPLLFIFAVVFGFASGSNTALIPSSLSQFCSIEEYGRYFSTAYFLSSFGTLTSIPIGGAILTATGGEYWGIIVFAALSYAAASVLYIASRGVSAGWSPKTKF